MPNKKSKAAKAGLTKKHSPTLLDRLPKTESEYLLRLIELNDRNINRTNGEGINALFKHQSDILHERLRNLEKNK